MDATEAVWSTFLFMGLVVGLGAMSWWAADKTIDGSRNAAAWAKSRPAWVKDIPDRARGSYETWSKANQGKSLQIVFAAFVGTANVAAKATEPLRAWAAREPAKPSPDRPEKRETAKKAAGAPEIPAPGAAALPGPDGPGWPSVPPGPGSPFRPDPALPAPSTPALPAGGTTGTELKPSAPQLPPQPSTPSLPAAPSAGPPQPVTQGNGAVMGTAVTKATTTVNNVAIATITGLSGVLNALKMLVQRSDEDITLGQQRLTASQRGLEEDTFLDARITEMIRAFEAVQEAYRNNQLEAAAGVPIQQAAVALQGAMVAHRNAHAAQEAAVQLRQTAQHRLVTANQQLQAAQTYIRRTHIPKAEVEAATGARSGRDFSTT